MREALFFREICGYGYGYGYLEVHDRWCVLFILELRHESREHRVCECCESCERDVRDVSNSERQCNNIDLSFTSRCHLLANSNPHLNSSLRYPNNLASLMASQSVSC